MSDAMSDDIVARLRVLNHHAKKLAENESLHDLHREAFTRCENLTLEAAAQIERLHVELGRYKRMYARANCRDLYSAGARWKIRPNPMRSDGVFIEEDCEPSKRRTYWPFPHGFEQDVAEEIVEILNRATDEMEATDGK